MAPSPLAPTKCLTECSNNNITWVAANSSHIGEVLAPTAAWELGDRKDMDQAPYIVTKDLLKVTPTKCSTICSSSDTKPDLTVVAPVTCTTLAVSSMVLVATDGTTGNTNIDAPVCFKETHAMCSMVGLDVNGGNDQVVVAFQTKTCVLRGDQALDVSIEVFMPSSYMLTPINGCSIIPLISLAITNILLDINSETADWQGPPSQVLLNTTSDVAIRKLVMGRINLWLPPTSNELVDTNNGQHSTSIGQGYIGCHHGLHQLNPGGLILLNIVNLQEVGNSIKVKVPWLLSDQPRFEGVPMDYLMTPWDPGGSGNNLHRLEDKPNAKEMGLLGT
uniref:Uncharacterized protein n=1 Tax=Oryza glumipatula TaxID=40148 RepID=A0A0E0AX13_9ORYZ